MPEGDRCLAAAGAPASRLPPHGARATQRRRAQRSRAWRRLRAACVCAPPGLVPTLPVRVEQLPARDNRIVQLERENDQLTEQCIQQERKCDQLVTQFAAESDRSAHLSTLVSQLESKNSHCTQRYDQAVQQLTEKSDQIARLEILVDQLETRNHNLTLHSLQEEGQVTPAEQDKPFNWLDFVYDTILSLSNGRRSGVQKTLIVDELWDMVVRAVRDFEEEGVMMARGDTVFLLVDLDEAG